ncbi:ABC transporter permease [Clostridia bacterium]|nr:ABC transporter permease [Clostridia bacterium]
MFNFTLYKREMKGSIKLLIILGAVMTLYVSMIISMFEPKMMESLQEMLDMMPGIMTAVGMKAGATTLIGFMSSYLYGFILLMFPMLFCILRGNALVAKYVDKGSMVSLLAAPVKRTAVVFTQMKVIASGVSLLVLYTTVLEIGCVAGNFPGELDISTLLLLNLGLLCLQLFIAGVCFFFSCLFSDTKYSVGFGAGIPALMYVLQMLANTGGDAEKFKYATFFTLFNPDGLIAGEASAIAGIVVLFVGTCALFFAAITVFGKKDLHI